MLEPSARVLAVSVLLLGPVAAQAAAAATAPPVLRWHRSTDAVTLFNRDRVVWRFHHGSAHPKPCFHPLATLDGTVLTDFRPADHPWHRAGWFSFKFIDGVNYWEEHKTTGVSAGTTETVDVRITTNPDFSARIELVLSYHPPQAPEVLREHRRILVSAPDAAGHYTLDWQHLFRARKTVELDRTPLPGQPGGKSYGGYAGLSLRLAPPTRKWQFRDSEGRTGASHGQRARWLSFAGDLPTGGAALTIFDHPANPAFPSRWFVSQGMPYFSPAFLFDGPLRLAAGHHLALSYRMRLHQGRPTPAQLETEYRAFTATGFTVLDPEDPAGRIDLVATGRQLFEANCVACHSTAPTGDEGKLGPRLYGLLGRTVQRRDVQVRQAADSLQSGGTRSVECDEQYVQTAVWNPSQHLAIRRDGPQAGQPYPPAMPPFTHFTAQQVHALVAFLKTLNEPAQRGPEQLLAYEQLAPPESYDRFEVVVTDRPKVYRVAMADVSTRAICVGLPGGFNYIFDPSTFTVRRAWGGGFLDLKAERTGRGKGYNRPSRRDHRPIPFAECLRPLGPSGPIDHDFRDYLNNRQWRVERAALEARITTPFLERRAPDGARFEGYQLVGNEPPTFLFTIDGVRYTQQLIFEHDLLLHFHFTTTGARGPIRFKVQEDRLREVRSTAGTLRDGVLSVPAAAADRFTISLLLDPDQVPPISGLHRHPALAGKANLAWGATASSPGRRDHGAVGPQGAIDGQEDTYWDETDGQPEYRLRIALPAAAAMSAAHIIGYGQHDFAPRDFEVLIDGKSVTRVRNASYDDNRLLVRFPRTTGRVVELLITGYYGRSPAIRELGLFDLGGAR